MPLVFTLLFKPARRCRPLTLLEAVPSRASKYLSHVFYGARVRWAATGSLEVLIRTKGFSGLIHVRICIGCHPLAHHPWSPHLGWTLGPPRIVVWVVTPLLFIIN